MACNYRTQPFRDCFRGILGGGYCAPLASGIAARQPAGCAESSESSMPMWRVAVLRVRPRLRCPSHLPFFLRRLPSVAFWLRRHLRRIFAFLPSARRSCSCHSSGINELFSRACFLPRGRQSSVSQPLFSHSVAEPYRFASKRSMLEVPIGFSGIF